MIFHSFTQKLPPIRYDIDIIPVQHEGEELIYFHDPMGYIQENFILDSGIAPYLDYFGQHLSIDELSQKGHFNADKKEFLTLVQFLDENNVLHSNHYKLFREKTESRFEEATYRDPWLAGKSYPEDPDEMAAYVHSLFEKPSETGTPGLGTIKALYAPHIDISVGSEHYASVFLQLKEMRPRRVVILGTSHYAGSYHPAYEGTPFIGSVKDYQLPGRVFKTDREYLNLLSDQSPDNGFTLQDRAHRIEHSIETHLLFVSQLWKHDFTVVPVLVAGLEEILYHPKADLMRKTEQFARQLKQADDDDTIYLISGDLSHTGKRFGDSLSASQLKASVQDTDRAFLRLAENSDAAGLLELLRGNLDKTRICGFPPLYLFLKAFGTLRAKKLQYEWWDDTETESAVSFGSVLYL